MTATTSDDDETFAEETLIQAIENQLETGEPAATQATLNKLTLVGYERDEILKMMALVLADEIRQMLEDDRPFDVERYETLLRALPDLPE
jgi:cytochrome c556